MITRAAYIFIASMDVDSDHEQVFNDVYDVEHIPNLLEVPGVTGVVRYRSVPFHVSIGGEVRQVDAQAPKYHALYALDAPDVLVSHEWARAVDRGRWQAEVRPFTSERRHSLLERISG